MAELSEYLIEKLKEWVPLKNVPEPIICEVVQASMAFLSELPTAVVENIDVPILDNLLHTDHHQVCTKCDDIVLTKHAVREEPQGATHIPRPTMCVGCWNKLAIAEKRLDDLYCEKCGHLQPCENEECATSSSEAS